MTDADSICPAAAVRVDVGNLTHVVGDVVTTHNLTMASVPKSRYGRVGVAPQEGYPYFWRVRTILPERYGQRCRVTARGKLNSRRVEFEDGFWVITLGNYVRRIAVSGPLYCSLSGSL